MSRGREEEEEEEGSVWLCVEFQFKRTEPRVSHNYAESRED